MNDNTLSVIYFGDETYYRKKKCGLSLIDQLLLSVNSIRNNWSKIVDIYFFHSETLSARTQHELYLLKVHIQKTDRVIEPEFPLSNKILVGEFYKGDKDILFLDCDTIIHKPINFEQENDILVAYDALKNIEREDYIKISNFLQLNLEDIELYDSPAFEYYFNDKIRQFSVFNSGVFFLKKEIQHKFYYEYENIFSALYSEFKTAKWKFYIEQIAFCMTIVKLKLNYSIFPKGYNFVCTPRADFLKNWDNNKIIIEHYAGDNGSPLNFDNKS